MSPFHQKKQELAALSSPGTLNLGVRLVPEAELNLGILNVSYGGTRKLDFIADSIDRRQICGMLRAIVNNIMGVI